MPDMHGRHGLVEVSDLPIGHIQKWSYKETVDKTDKTSMGDTAKSYDGGLPDGGFDLESNWDASDTGQAAVRAALQAGTHVPVSIYPSGSKSTGEPVITGSVLIESKEVSGELSGMVAAKFTGVGQMTEGTVSA